MNGIIYNFNKDTKATMPSNLVQINRSKRETRYFVIKTENYVKGEYEHLSYSNKRYNTPVCSVELVQLEVSIFMAENLTKNISV